MFTLSAEVQREAAEKVCQLIAERLGVEPPVDYAHPWELLVDGYLAVEIHFHRGRCFFVGVVVEHLPNDPGEIFRRALQLSRERCALGAAALTLDHDHQRLILWKPAGESGSEEDILRAFETILKELDLWFSTLIDLPSPRSALAGGFAGLLG